MKRMKGVTEWGVKEVTQNSKLEKREATKEEQKKKEWRDKNIKVNEQERNDGGGVKKFEAWLKFMASFI